MTLDDIKKAVRAGRTVHWVSKAYHVTVRHGHWYIVHERGHCIALTWTDGVTLNGDEHEFFPGDDT